MVEAVFLFEKRSGMRVGLWLRSAPRDLGHRLRMRTHALVQPMQIATGAERLFTGATQDHAGNLRIIGPGT